MNSRAPDRRGSPRTLLAKWPLTAGRRRAVLRPEDHFVINCGTCRKAAGPGTAPARELAPVWAHTSPAAEQHGPVSRRSSSPATTPRGDWWDADCPESSRVPRPRGRGTSGEAKSVAWALLREGTTDPPHVIRAHSGRRLSRTPDAERLLGAVAGALTACEAAGITVKLKHGAVITRFGFVFPVGDKQWGARTRAYSPFGSAERRRCGRTEAGTPPGRRPELEAPYGRCTRWLSAGSSSCPST